MRALRLGRAHAGLAAAAVVLAGGIAVVGMGDREPAREVRLLSGAAWLTSSKVGQVTLLDGSAVEVAAQVRVAAPGSRLDVAQQGSTAFAVDQSAGAVRRVDGATFAVSAPAEPIPDARAGGRLVALPAADTLYTVDNQRGVLASVDPGNLTRRGELVSLAGELGASSAVVDGAGTLWSIDARTGDLTSVAGGRRNIRRQVTRPGPSLLATANGHPVAVDLTERKAITIDRENGRAGRVLDLDLRTTDTVQVSGSPRAERLYLVASRGVLLVCDLPAGSENLIPLNAANTYGPAVEAGDRLFVPDYTTGQVWIVDLAGSKVVASPTVLTPPAPFQLLSRDGVVFYNDPDTERAGVIRFDGSVIGSAKYDPKDPAKGLIEPAPAPTTPTPRPQPPKQSPPPQQPGRPTQTPLTPGSAQPEMPDREDPGNPQPQPGPADPSSSPTQPDDPGAPPPVTEEPRLEVSMSDVSPTENQVVTLRVSNTNGDQPTSAHWTFGDDAEGDGTTTSHRWATARPTPYLVTVTATLPDGRQATTSVTVTVSETPRVRLTVEIPGGGGAVAGGGINCPPTCFVDLEPDTQVTLTATPDATHGNGLWGGACSGKLTTCDVTLDVAKTVSRTFPVITAPPPQATITITAPDHGQVGRNQPGGRLCTQRETCTFTYPLGAQAELGVRPDSGYEFEAWGGACAGQGERCRLTMDSNKTASVTVRPLSLPRITSFNCGTLARTTFSCDITVNTTERQIRWTVNGAPISTANDNTHLSGTCDRNLNADVRVTVINARGNDTRGVPVRCQGGS